MQLIIKNKDVLRSMRYLLNISLHIFVLSWDSDIVESKYPVLKPSGIKSIDLVIYIHILI